MTGNIETYKRAGELFSKGSAYRKAGLYLFISYAARCFRTRKDFGNYAQFWGTYSLEMRKQLFAAIKQGFQGYALLSLSGELTATFPKGKEGKAFSAYLEKLERNPSLAFVKEKKAREKRSFEQRLLALIPIAEKSEEKIAAAFLEFMNQHK